MKEYYSDKHATIYHGDCLELLPEMPKINLILTDLPYGMTRCQWDTIIPFDEMWVNIDLVINRNTPVLLFGLEPFVSRLRMSNIKNYKYDWIWEENLISGWLNSKTRPLVGHENISVFYEQQPTYNPIKVLRTEESLKRLKYKHSISYKNSYDGYGNAEYTSETTDSKYSYPKSVLKINKNHTEDGLHPTQKPIELMEYFIKTYSHENEIVLDFAMGSGTTLVAAKQLNRKAIGIEIEEKYCEIASKRLSQEVLDFS